MREANASASATPLSNAHLNVYDLRGTENVNENISPWGFGVFHAGVEVYGVEWSFGFVAACDPSAPPASGVYPIIPRSSPIGTYRQTVGLGKLQSHTATDVWKLLTGLAGEWLGHSYHPFNHNCLHFCAELCGHLGLDPPPDWVGRLPGVADALLTPLCDALDVPVVPRRSIRACRKDACTSSENGSRACSCSECMLSNDGLQAPEPKLEESTIGSEMKPWKKRGSVLSVATKVALEFEKKLHWSLEIMLFNENRSRESSEQCT